MVPAHAGTGLICVEERFHCEGFGDIGALLVFGQTFAFAVVPAPIEFTSIPQEKLILP